jgi:hypothetical protein
VGHPFCPSGRPGLPPSIVALPCLEKRETWGTRLDSTTQHYNEKFDAEVTLAGNTIGWQLSAAQNGGSTFGYGVFDIKVENTLPNQTAINAISGNLTYSILHITINQVYDFTGSFPCPAKADSNGVVLGAAASWVSHVVQIHIESPCGLDPGYHEISIPSLTSFSNIGNINQTFPNSNVTGNAAYNYPVGWPQIWPQFTTPAEWHNRTK